MTSRETGLCNEIIHSASVVAATVSEAIGWIMAKEFESQSVFA